MSESQRKLSEEVLNWYYVGDEIPAKEWATRIAELEAALALYVHLATCDMEGLAPPTPDQWMEAYVKAEEALGD